MNEYVACLRILDWLLIDAFGNGYDIQDDKNRKEKLCVISKNIQVN